MATFDESVQDFVPPSNSMGQVVRITNHLEAIKPRHKTNMGDCLAELTTRMHRREIVMIFSDFFGDLDSLEAALQREVKSPFRLILTAGGSLVVPGTKSACLDEVLELDPVSGDVVECSDLRAIVEVPFESTGGRPNVYGANLDTIIQSRLGNGQALLGRNEEGKAILDVYRKQFPQPACC